MFQVALNSAAGYHFRPQTDFAARSQSCLDDGRGQSARARREMRRHFAASNDLGVDRMWTRRMSVRMMARYFVQLMSQLVAIRWFFAFWANAGIRIEDVNWHSASTVIRVSIWLRGSVDPWMRFVTQVGPNDGSGWTARNAALAVVRYGLVEAYVGLVMGQVEVVESACPRC